MGDKTWLQLNEVTKFEKKIVVTIKTPFRFMTYGGMVDVVAEHFLYNVH